MKKVLSLVLVLAMVLGMMPVFAAGETGADQLYKYGFIAGNNGDLMVDKELTRAEMAVLVAEMNGLKEEAANYAAPANFSDVTAGKWYTPYVAYGQANGWWAGYPDGTFKPEIGMSGQEFAAVLMNALKYDATWNTVVADAAAIGITVKTTNFTRGDAFESMWTAVNMPVKGEEVALGVKLGRLESAMLPTTGELSVVSIKATSAKNFTVKFNKAVTDADKITFAVKKLDSPFTVVTAWNEAKNEAQLSTSSNLGESVYEVSVLADAKEVAKESITITAQKVAKIEFTSKSVAVEMTDINGNLKNDGYVTYKTYDQYGNDITASYLSNNMTFTTGAGTATAKDGLVTIVPGATALLQFQSISIIAYDTTSNVSSTVTLSTSSSVGTIKSFTLGSVDGLSLVENDVSTTFYLPYTATDMSDNETKNYDLIIGGLIDGDSTAPGINLTVSLSSHVIATIVKDPNDSNKAAIEIKAKNSTSSLAMDMPVSITAMSYAGGTSTVNTTIAKTKTIKSISLLSPSETVAAGETPEIKFEAYDQFGNKVTKFSDIDGKVSFTNLFLSENTDGSAKLEASTSNTAKLPLAKGTTTLTAVVSNSGKMSTLTLNVQEALIPTKLVLDTTDIVYAMEVGATQEFILDEDDMIKVYDQYDRQMSSTDIDKYFKPVFTGTTLTSYDYKVMVSAINGSTITVTDLAAAGKSTFVNALGAAGSDTVTFSLVKFVPAAGTVAATTKTINSVQVSLAYITTKDITDYTINTFSKPIYTSVARNTVTGLPGTPKDVDSRYDAEVKIYGKTNSGSKVLLAGAPVQMAYVSNADDFVVATTGGAYDVVRVNATKPVDTTKTGGETVVTVNLKHNEKISTLTTDLKSSTAKPVAASIALSSADNNDDSATQAETNGKYLVDYDAAGNSAPAASFKFRITDQYGSRAMAFTSFTVAKATNAAGTSIGTGGITISTAGQVTINASHVANNSYWITATTSNGLKETVKLTITD